MTEERLKEIEKLLDQNDKFMPGVPVDDECRELVAEVRRLRAAILKHRGLEPLVEAYSADIELWAALEESGE